MASLKDRLNQDLKTALLSGDKATAEVLRYLKAAILNEEVAKMARESGLSDEQIISVFAKEAKKRAESADIYEQAGHLDRATSERKEKAIIDTYLPAQLTDEQLVALIDEAIHATGENAQIGQVIGVVKAKVGAQADGGRIAALVKAKLG